MSFACLFGLRLDEVQLTRGPEIVIARDDLVKIIQVKQKDASRRDRHKSYADLKRNDGVEVGEKSDALGFALERGCTFWQTRNKSRPLIYSTIEEDGKIREKKYAELTEQEKLQDDCYVQATNIVLQGLPPDVYSFVNHCKAVKDIWDRVKLLMQGTKLSYQERECKMYNEFDKFTSVKGESLYEYYLLFAQLINDKHIIGMTMQQVVHENTKIMECSSNSEWSKFVTKWLGLCCWFHHFYSDVIAGLNNSNGIYVNCDGLTFFLQPKPTTKTFSNPRNQATIQRWQGVTCSTSQAQESGQELDEEQLAFLADPEVADGQATQTTISQNVAFQTDDLDAYDSDCDDISVTPLKSDCSG
ncbi:hypothetical protein Tco_0680272 [Tanacetum coccineum]|uniref:Uncharacterized protein n=1 Tax=Tanacetum coccineum TaxID=301880 RepID=A0ABQ4XL76_9ASTR